jgi:hypothetical protein
VNRSPKQHYCHYPLEKQHSAIASNHCLHRLRCIAWLDDLVCVAISKRQTQTADDDRATARAQARC